MVPIEDTWHVSRVHKRVLKLVNFLVQNLLKPYMFNLGTHSTRIYDVLWSICRMGGLQIPLKNCLVLLHPCVHSRINILHTFLNILEHSAYIIEHSGTFRNIQEHSSYILEHSGTFCIHSATFRIDSGTFCNILEHSVTFCIHSETFWNLLVPSRKVDFQVVHTITHGQIDGQTDRHWDLLSCAFAAKNLTFTF